MKENVVIRQNGCVNINNLENDVCKGLINMLHTKVVFGKKIYCNGVISLTPEKALESSRTGESNEIDPHIVGSLSTSSGSIAETTSQVAVLGSSTSVSVPVPICSASASDMPLVDPSSNYNDSNVEFVRRHSLSLRSPTKGSLAADILSVPPPLEELKCQREKTMNLLADVRGLSERLSDFASCKSSSEDEGGEVFPQKFKMSNANRRGFKKKRSESITPPKEYFLKKNKYND